MSVLFLLSERQMKRITLHFPLSHGVPNLLPSYNSVAYLESKASFGKDGALLVDGKKLNATKFIITTGARPALPSIKGIENVPYLTSTTALELQELPESLIVIGLGLSALKSLN